MFLLKSSFNVGEVNEKLQEDVESFLYDRDNLFAHFYTSGSRFILKNGNTQSKLRMLNKSFLAMIAGLVGLHCVEIKNR